jgi:hypothetical protein
MTFSAPTGGNRRSAFGPDTHDVSTNRSANAMALGVRIGVRMIRMRSDRKDQIRAVG